MSKIQKRLFLFTSPLVVALPLMLVAHQLQGVQRRAHDLAEAGRDTIALFKEYGAALRAHDVERALALYDGDFAAARGAWLQELESDRDGVRTWRWLADEARPLDRAGVGALLGELLAPVDTLELAKIKLALIERQAARESSVLTVLWLRGRTGTDEIFETQARLRFELVRTDAGLRIRDQEVLEGSTVVGAGAGFVNVAAPAGLDFVAQRNPLFATPEWYPEKFGILKYGSAGVSAADYDGDGWYDLYFADGASSKLYRNRGDGTFYETTAEAGLPVDLPGINVALFVDLDNDGDKDAFLGRFMDGSRLYRNDGGGRFTDVTATANVGRGFVTVASAADYDLDGDLDLYVGRYLDPRVDLPTTLFYTRNSQGNSLLRNDGGLRFTDVTDEAGVREGGLTLGVAWGDYDRDGDPDLYVANDFGRNALFQNQRDGSFRDVSEESGTLDFGFGMSASFGDVDNDLDLDLYVSNVHSGQRWYSQATTLYQYLLTSIKQGTILEDYPLYREILGYAGADWGNYGDRMVKGNSLLLNDGDGNFEDHAERAGVNPFGWYWASTFFDYDHDGLQDIYAANGWITTEVQDDL